MAEDPKPEDPKPVDPELEESKNKLEAAAKEEGTHVENVKILEKDEQDAAKNLNSAQKVAEVDQYKVDKTANGIKATENELASVKKDDVNNEKLLSTSNKNLAKAEKELQGIEKQESEKQKLVDDTQAEINKKNYEKNYYEEEARKSNENAGKAGVAHQKALTDEKLADAKVKDTEKTAKALETKAKTNPSFKAKAEEARREANEAKSAKAVATAKVDNTKKELERHTNAGTKYQSDAEQSGLKAAGLQSDLEKKKEKLGGAKDKAQQKRNEVAGRKETHNRRQEAHNNSQKKIGQLQSKKEGMKASLANRKDALKNSQANLKTQKDNFSNKNKAANTGRENLKTAQVNTQAAKKNFKQAGGKMNNVTMPEGTGGTGGKIPSTSTAGQPMGASSLADKVAISATFNYRESRKHSFDVTGAASIEATMVAVPAPEKLVAFLTQLNSEDE